MASSTPKYSSSLDADTTNRQIACLWKFTRTRRVLIYVQHPFIYHGVEIGVNFNNIQTSAVMKIIMTEMGNKHTPTLVPTSKSDPTGIMNNTAKQRKITRYLFVFLLVTWSSQIGPVSHIFGNGFRKHDQLCHKVPSCPPSLYNEANLPPNLSIFDKMAQNHRPITY